MKKIAQLFLLLALAACDTPEKSQSTAPPRPLISAADLKLSPQPDAVLAASGRRTYEAKCQSCHRLSADKLVGPGWSGVTKRRAPEWIMNLLLDPNPVLDGDPEARAMLAEYSIRMPDQQLQPAEARALLEFMRSNNTQQQ